MTPADGATAGRASRPGSRRIWWVAVGLAFFGLLPGLARLLLRWPVVTRMRRRPPNRTPRGYRSSCMG